MSLNRRMFVQAGLAAAAGASPLWSAAQPADWPQNPVRFIVPFAPGGGADGATRMVAEQLRTLWGGVGAVVDNKPGANTIIATETVLRAPRDGYTFLATITLTMQLPHLMQKVSFDPMADLVPVGAITVEQLVLVTSPAAKVGTLPELLKAAKADPRRYAFGSYGIGSTSHLLQIEISKAAGVELVHAPYRGAAPAVQAVLGGEVALALSNLGTVKQHIDAGKLIPLAVTGEQRFRFLPGVPTLSELGFKGFETPAWIGLFAAKGVPQPIIDKLSADLQTVLKTPELTAKINSFGQETGQMSMSQFRALIKRDNDNAARMIRAAGVRLE